MIFYPKYGIIMDDYGMIMDDFWANMIYPKWFHPTKYGMIQLIQLIQRI